MARTIESPGVEIKERDLSFNSSLPIGTKVMVCGFAPQGPVNELVYVTNGLEEFEQIYGTPTNAAERYFYQSCKEVLRSPASLFVTRLPYGSGEGAGFGNNYSAVAYPVNAYNITSVNVINTAISTIATTFSSVPTFKNIKPFSLMFYADSTLTLTDFKQAGNIGYLYDSYNAPTVSATLDYTTGSITSVWPTSTSLPMVSATFDVIYGAGSASFTTAKHFEFGAPKVYPISQTTYEDIKAGQIDWSATAGLTVATSASLGNAGFIVVNDAKTTVDEQYQGYYIGFADNEQAVSIGYDCVQSVSSINSASAPVVVPSTTMDFYLTGNDSTNPNSVSEIIENGFNYDFSNSDFSSSIILTLFKLRTSNYASDPNKLYALPIENFVGSFDSKQQLANVNTGVLENFYIQTKVNDKSNYIQLFVNKNLGENTNWLTSGSRDGIVRNTGKSLTTIGNFASNKANSTDKLIGDLPSKLEKALVLAENRELVDLDIIPEAGLGTVWAYVEDTKDSAGFDDTMNVAVKTSDLADPNQGESSKICQDYKTIFNIFETFVRETRKDCIYIADPLRGIFIQGTNYKVLDRKDRTFSQHIYAPLKNLFGSANSNYAGTYANWVSVYDSNASDFVWMPFSAFQASIFARMDSNSYPWFAAAGLNDGIIRNITDIAIKPTQKQRDMLYKIGVNPVVYFPGDGFVVWGQKTLQAKPSAFDRWNVRRLFLVLEKASLRILRYFVFQPNSVFTRTRVVNVLKPIFDVAKNNDGVYDYYLVCDERNNTSDVIDNNEMKFDAYLKPVRSAEFILATFTATRTGDDFNELIG